MRQFVRQCGSPVETMIHKAKDLSPDQRKAVEALIGQTLSEQDHVSVRRLRPPANVSPDRRQATLVGIDQFFARIDSQRQPASAEEANAIIDEALRLTRPDYRPIR